MKKKIMITMFVVFSLISVCVTKAHAGGMDILVNKLVEKGILTNYEAQILLAEAKEEAVKDIAKGKAVTAPSWTQKIKIKGDVRFRTQADFADNKDNSAGYELRQRIRARVGIEGKVNDEIYGGVRLVTGSDDARSTNETMSDDGIFAHPYARFDQYYIRWQPELPKNIGTAKLWGGKFKNPMQKTELLFDGDITPDGMAVQYMSTPFELGNMPASLYSNLGYFWLDNDSGSGAWTKGNPMMVAMQAGLKMDIIEDWNSKLNLAIAYYDLANVQNEGRDISDSQSTDGSGTNTFNTGTTVWKYDYNLVDFLIKYDSKKMFDFEIGNGIYADLIWNTDPGKNDFAWMLGGYLGNAKVKKPGQWKLWGNWRYIERDAVPDFLPDSDFFGWVKESGVYAGGGTNAKGWNLGFQYGLLKNTVLGLEYYWMEPIKLNNGIAGDVEPYQLIQLDVKVKF